MMFPRLSLISLLAVPAVLSFCGLSAFAAPANAELARRQVGNLQCNLDRLGIVAALGRTKTDVNDIASAGSGDDAVTTATSDALSGLSTAEGGINTILRALIAGQTAPADARDQVGDGLTAIQTALNSITSTDPDVTSALSTAQSDLTDAINAGNGVVANCK